jgi:hypothetical protein
MMTLWGEEVTESKECIYCKKEKPLTDFPKHVAYRDNLDSRCRTCIKEQTNLRKKILMTAPPKPKHCECCGTETNLVMDHCHDTDKFRGWLCDNCNLGISKFKDNLPGIMMAVRYLESRCSSNT